MLGGMLYFVARDVPEWKKPAAVPAGVVRGGIFCQNVKGIKVLDRSPAVRAKKRPKH
jgi:hypothetical protein